MNRREELLKLVDKSNASTIVPLIDKMLFIENQLENLEKLPMIKVHPDNPEIQKATPAAKLYKEFLQQYTNIIKVISHNIEDESDGKDSPLNRWVKSRNEILDDIKSGKGLKPLC